TTATRYLSNTGTSNNPAWNTINLSNGVNSTLGTVNGGLGADFSTSTGFLFATGAGTVLNRTAVSLTTEVSGTLPLTSGGSGQTTANAALNAFLPSQTGNNGKVLGTTGSNAQWIDSSGILTGDVRVPLATGARVVYADKYAGADRGAQINTANADLGSSPGTIVVPGGGTYSTQV